MHDEPSLLLAQVPLTVSPFINLPKPPTLPHNYASLPSTLPPSILHPPVSSASAAAAAAGAGAGGAAAAAAAADAPHPYVTAPQPHSSSFSAHPTQIIAQNKALLASLDNTAREAQRVVTEWERGIERRELAEKRRRAPGWLDSEEKMLEPARKQGQGQGQGQQKQGRDLLGDDDDDEDDDERMERKKTGSGPGTGGGAGEVGRGVGGGDDGKGLELGRLMDRAFGGAGLG